MIFLVAANPQAARACARSHNLDPRVWRYCADPHALQGYYKQTAWLVDGYLDRPNAEQLLREFDRRDFTVVNRSITKKGVKPHVRTRRVGDDDGIADGKRPQRDRAKPGTSDDLFL